MTSDVDMVKDRTNIVDVIGQHLTLHKAGTNWKGLCPFHKEKTPSFSVSEEKQFYHCFGCSKSGDVFTFMMEMEGLDFREALQTLATRAGVELSGAGQQQQAKKTPLFALTERATKFFEKQLWDGMGKGAALDYLHGRGLNDTTLKTFRVGYAPPGWRNLLEFLHKDYSLPEILATGLIIQKADDQSAAPAQTDDPQKFYDRFRDRIMFPVADHLERVVGYSGRVGPGGDESQAKYINTPETALYHKSQVLYGIEHAKAAMREKKEAIIVEGNIDVLAMHQAGLTHTVAVSGTALTEDHVRILARYADTIYLFFDMDAAGQTAARKSARTCLAQGLQTKVLATDGGKDAADLLADDPTALEKIVADARDAIAYFTDVERKARDLSQPAEKQQAVSAVAELIAVMPGAVERQEWVHATATTLSVDEDAVSETLTTQMQRKEEEAARMVTRTPQTEPTARATTEQSRADVIEQHILGMMVSNDQVWQSVAKSAAELKDDFRNPLFDALVTCGTDTNYSLEGCAEKTLSQDDFATLRDYQFLFQKEHVDLEHHDKILADYLSQLRQERQRQHTQTVSAAIVAAEQAGDTAKVSELMKKLRSES